MKDIANYTDEKGFVGHRHPTWGLEFGDGTQRLGTKFIAKYITDPGGRPKHSKELLAAVTSIYKTTKENGKEKIQYVRHWDSKRWPGKLWTMSRDNLDPLIQAMILYSPYNQVLKYATDRLIKELWSRGGFLWNWKGIWPKTTDEPKIPDWYFLCLSLVSFTIRHRKMHILYPLLWLVDFQLIFNSKVRVFMSYVKPDSTSDDLNHQNWLVFCQLVFKNPIVWIAKQIYKLRGRAAVDGKRLVGYGPLTVYEQYYNGPNNPPMDGLWRPVVDKYLT